ncbi:hypothetical protein TMatcc_008869, partial [Talaromyces marneffei ATCC 18224]
IVSVLVLSALAASAPTLGRSFSINLVPINISRVHPAVKYARAYIKHGVDIPNYLALATRSGCLNQSGSVRVDSYLEDAAYLSPVKVGNNILFLYPDTGSGDFWAYTRNTPGAATHYVYDTSTGTKLPNQYWHIEYIDGSTAGGAVYTDKVEVGNVSFSNQAIGIADYLQSSQVVFTEIIDGMMGLAFSSLNTVRPTKQPTFYDNVKPSLQTPVFAAYLKHNASGVFDFGFIDSSKYSGEIVYKDVDSSRGQWNVTLDGYSIGDTFSASDCFNAIVDTGTSLLLLDHEIVQNYYAPIPSSQFSLRHGGWIFNCADDIPTFTVKIGPLDVVIPAEYLNYGSLGTSCYGGLQCSPHNSYGILGDVFLKVLYVIFDDGTTSSPRVGFAKQASLSVPKV